MIYATKPLMLLDRGVELDDTTISQSIQAYAAELEKCIRLPSDAVSA